MSEDMFLGIKVQDMLIRAQERILDMTIERKDTIEEVHKYRLFCDELKGLIKKWEYVI